MEEVATLKAALDTDGDGKITKNEFLANGSRCVPVHEITLYLPKCFLISVPARNTRRALFEKPLESVAQGMAAEPDCTIM